MKKCFLLLLGLASLVVLGACASKDAIVVQSNLMSGLHYLRVSHPEPVQIDLPFAQDDKFVYRIDSYDEEWGFFKVSLTGGKVGESGVILNFRGMPLSLIQRDTSFVPPETSSDSAVVMYYLNWDAEYSFQNFELLRKGLVVSSRYDSENKMGVICLRGKDEFRECSAAKMTGKGNLYIFLADSKNPNINLEDYVVKSMKSLSHYEP